MYSLLYLNLEYRETSATVNKEKQGYSSHEILYHKTIAGKSIQ